MTDKLQGGLVIKAYPFLTVIPSRSPQQKMHTGLGHAKNAFTEARKTGQIYEWDSSDNDWVLLYDVTERRGYGPGAVRENRPWKLEQEEKK